MIVRLRRHRFMEEAAGAEAGGAGGPVGAPAAPAAPVAAPVAPAPAAPLTLDEPPAPAPAAPSAPVVYEPTGDAGLDLALDYVGNLGFGPDHAAIVAAESGDFSALEAALKALGDKAKGFDRYLALAKQAVGSKVEAAKARLEKDQATVHQAVGGQENWNAIVDWAKANAEPEEKAAVNQALKAGGIAAKAMAVYLSGLWQKSAGAEINPAPAVQTSAAANPGVTAGPITAREFADQSAALRRELGPTFEQHPKFKQVIQRRAAGMSRGI